MKKIKNDNEMNVLLSKLLDKEEFEILEKIIASKGKLGGSEDK